VNVVALLFLFSAGAVAQALLPTAPWLGQAHAPILLSLSLYYALTRPRAAALAAALAAGVLNDALGPIPLGYSSAGFAAAALAVSRYREEVFVWRHVTHMIFGALSSAGVTLALAALLQATGLVSLAPGLAALKTAGAFVLGAATLPAVYAVGRRIDTMLGLAAPDSTAARAWRSPLR
jgi:cell shape-determining protein MreD